MRWPPQRRHTVLLLYTLSYFATRVEPLVVAPLIPDITAALGTTSGAIGTAMTGFWATYALAQLPSGIVADRYGRRRVIIAVLVCGSVGSVLLALSPSILAFTAVTVALGGCLGLYYNVGVLSLNEQFDSTGWALGVHRIGSQAAGLVVPVVAAAIGAWYSWQTSLLLGAAVALPAAVLVGVVIRPTPPRNPATSIRSRFERILTEFDSTRTVGKATLIAGIGEFVAVANVTFLPTFLVVFHGFDPVVAGGVFSLYFLIVSATHPVAGWCADRYRAETVVGAALTVGVGSHAALVFVPTRIGAIVGVGAAALTMGYNVPIQSKLLGSLPDENRARVFGVFRTGYVLLGSLGGAVAGTIADHSGWGAAYGVLAVILLCGLVILFAAGSVTDGSPGS